MAPSWRHFLLCVTVLALSMQSLRPAIAMNCGCTHTPHHQLPSPATPEKPCCCNPDVKSCCCGMDDPAPQDDPAKVICHCSHEQVPLPAVPIPAVNHLLQIDLSMVETAMLLDVATVRIVQRTPTLRRHSVTAYPTDFARICYNHWLI